MPRPSETAKIQRAELKASLALFESAVMFYFDRATTDAMRAAIIRAFNAMFTKFLKEIRNILPPGEDCPDGFVKAMNGDCVRPRP